MRSPPKHKRSRAQQQNGIALSDNIVNFILR